MKNRLLTILLPLFLFSCNESKEFKTTKEESTKYISVEINTLLENPSRFDGKYIEATGILLYEFENVGLYKTRADANRKDSKNALWTDFEEGLLPEEELEKLKNKKVIVRGLVNSASKGHLMQFAGTLEKVDYLKY
ncbi:hypothetical protein [Rufibacter sp. LB8]|nr:hypothetical protein [Rufibacter sp. LB8]